MKNVINTILTIVIVFLNLSPVYGIEIRGLPAKPKDYLIKLNATIPHEKTLSPDIIIRDLDGDGKNEILFLDGRYRLMIFEYQSGIFKKMSDTPENAKIMDFKVIKLDGRQNLFIVTAGIKGLRVYKYLKKKLVEQCTLEEKEVGTSTAGI